MDKKYTAKELDLLHAELYDILGETIRICRKHDIPYFVIGGTAIGALYDRAILPWDDDIDIGMARKDYNRFLEVAPRELGDSYFLSWIETDPHSPYYYAKVKKNNTLFVEEMFKNVPMHPGIFVDIFPFDRIPDNKLLRKLQYDRFPQMLPHGKRDMDVETLRQMRDRTSHRPGSLLLLLE